MAADYRASLADPRVRKILAMKGVDVEAIDRLPAPADDPDAAECRERLAKAREAKAPAAVPAPARARTESPLRACVSCGHRVNTFSRECFNCGEPQPTAADCKPVRPPTPTPVPEPAPEEPAVPTATPTASAKGDHREAAPAKNCPDCGKPCHPANGRCYQCRPGGGKAREGRPESVLVADAEPSPPATTRPARPRSSANRPDVPLDPEVSAIARVLDALEGLSDGQLRRVLGYVHDRLEIPAQAR